ncbi:MAG: hypothetical protein M4D85_08570 [Actinomycetota bacterium]|nr:hypothetical protein [Actinomycetota bacterium]
MPRPDPTWTLHGFEECLDAWIEREQPSEDLSYVVTEWAISRSEDPYGGVRREPGFDNLWFGSVPLSGDGRGNAVACAYWIEEGTRTVRCDSIATLSQPI